MQPMATTQAKFVLGGTLLATISFHWGVLRGIEGIGLALFFLVALSVLEGVIRIFRVRTNVWPRVFLIPFGIATLNAALYSHDTTRIFSVLVGWFSFTLYAYWSTTARVAWRDVRWLAPTGYLFETALPAESAKTPFVFWKEHSSSLSRVLVGVGIAIPIVLILGALFSGADPVFRQLIEGIFPGEKELESLIARLIVDAVFVIAFARGLWLLLTRKDEARTIADAQPEEDQEAVVHKDIATTILALMSVFTGIFVAVQVRVALGGEAWMRSMDLTYAEYARSGYQQMIVACGLIGAVLLALYWLHSLRSRSTRWLSYVLLAEGLVILLSAWGRLQRYIDAYSLTTDRLWAQVGIVGLVLAALALMWSLVRGYRFARFSTAFIIGAMTYIVAVPCVLNIEARVVAANVYTREVGKLDFEYMSRLSSDGLLTLDAWEKYFAYGNADARQMLQEHVNAIRAQKDPPLSFTINDYRLIRAYERVVSAP